MKKSDRGSAYATVLMISVTLGAGVSALALLSKTRTRHSEMAVSKRVALTEGEAACEAAAKQLLDALASYDTPNIPDDPDNPMQVDISIDGQVITCFVSPADVTPIVETDTDGVISTLFQWVVTAQPVSSEGVSEQVTCVFQSRGTPLFQYAVFYGETCEIQPGPNMTLGGRVHSNGDIHIAVGDGNTLTVDTTYFRSAGDMWRHRLDGAENYTTGIVRVKDADSGAFVNWAGTSGSNLESDDSDWVDQTNALWGGGAPGTIQSQDHGVTAKAVPDIGTLQEGGHYYNEAGMVILDGQCFIRDSDGSLVDVTGSLPPGTIVASTMANQREGTVVETWDVDVDLLLNTTNGSSFLSTTAHFNAGHQFNGILWVGNTTATAGDPDPTRFKNADILNQSTAKSVGGLTIASDKPVMIWGDFNDGHASSGTEDSGQWVPASVMADSVELLSNSWNNTKTLGGGLPTASNSNYYAAILSGNVETSGPGGSYSGGLENLPRFHENWSGKTAKFRGAFVCLFESQYADGQWVYGGSYYTAPNRDWIFDTRLLTNEPPGAPKAQEIDRLVYTDDNRE